MEIELQTDAQGRVALGPLPDISHFRIREPMGTEHIWATAADACSLPNYLNGRTGETLRIPAAFPGAGQPAAGG